MALHGGNVNAATHCATIKVAASAPSAMPNKERKRSAERASASLAFRTRRQLRCAPAVNTATSMRHPIGIANETQRCCSTHSQGSVARRRPWFASASSGFRHIASNVRADTSRDGSDDARADIGDQVDRQPDADGEIPVEAIVGGVAERLAGLSPKKKEQR